VLTILHQRNFALLWLGGLVSQTGDWLLQIGIPVYIYLLTHSALATSVTLIISFLPNIVLSPIAGVFVDRWDRRRTMLFSNLLMALGLLPLLLIHDKNILWLLYIMLFFESCVSQFVLPAENALIPNLVNAQDLIPANALKSTSTYIARLAGAALGGILLGTIGLQSVILLDTSSFLFVCLMLLLMTPLPHRETTPRTVSPEEGVSVLLASWRHLLQEWLEGMQLVRRNYTLRVLFIFWMVTGLGEGIFGTMLIIFVNRVLHSGALVYGLLLSIQMIGNLSGTLLVAQFGKRLPLLSTLWMSACIFGIIDLLIIDMPIFYPDIILVMVFFALVGLPGTFTFVNLQTLFQMTVEDKLRGRVFATMMAASSVASLGGMLLAGTLGDALGPIPLLNLQGGSYVFAGLLVLLAMRKYRVQPLQMDRAEAT
jgi:MFS family permease